MSVEYLLGAATRAFKENEKVLTVMMEVEVGNRLYCWHVFFGISGCSSGIKVIEALKIQEMISTRTFLRRVEFTVNMEKEKPYFFAESSEPKSLLFVHSVAKPKNEQESFLVLLQKVGRNALERAYGVLQAKWHIVSLPSRSWRLERMKKIGLRWVMLN